MLLCAGADLIRVSLLGVPCMSIQSWARDSFALLIRASRGGAAGSMPNMAQMQDALHSCMHALRPVGHGAWNPCFPSHIHAAVLDK